MWFLRLRICYLLVIWLDCLLRNAVNRLFSGGIVLSSSKYPVRCTFLLNLFRFSRIFFFWLLIVYFICHLFLLTSLFLLRCKLSCSLCRNCSSILFDGFILLLRFLVLNSGCRNGNFFFNILQFVFLILCCPFFWLFNRCSNLIYYSSDILLSSCRFFLFFDRFWNSGYLLDGILSRSFLFNFLLALITLINDFICKSLVVSDS